MHTILEKRNPNYSSRKRTKRILGYMNEEDMTKAKTDFNKIQVKCPWCDTSQFIWIDNSELIENWRLCFYCKKLFCFDVMDVGFTSHIINSFL
jgi:hypothetical protein